MPRCRQGIGQAEAGSSIVGDSVSAIGGTGTTSGVALVDAVLGQAGKPLPVLRAGTWTEVPGWGEMQRRRIRIDRDRSLGKRWLSACDAPDLVLLPNARPTARNAADAVFLLVHAQPPSRDLAVQANNLILARADASPEGETLRADGRRLLRAAQTNDAAAWAEAVADLCLLAGRC